MDFNFEAEVKCLPFKLNLGDEAKLTCIQQSQFIDLIYDHPEVFSLHDEDLGFCDWIKHTIPITMTDKPVYLAHRTIPPQLQGETHKCLDTWLQQGIIRPSAESICFPGGNCVKENWGNSSMHGLL